MQQPFRAQTIDQVNDLLAILFRQAQSGSFKYLEFSGTGIWPSADSVPEKGLVLAQNTTDGVSRIYVKIKNVLKFVAVS